MKNHRCVRLFVLALCAAGLSACHFHGGHCHGFGWSLHVPVPVHRCR